MSDSSKGDDAASDLIFPPGAIPAPPTLRGGASSLKPVAAAGDGVHHG